MPDAQEPNISQTLQGDAGSASANPVVTDKESAMKSFLGHFGLGGNKDQVPAQPDVQSAPQEPSPSADISSFSSRLDEVGNQPAGINPPDATPSPIDRMAGADVVKEPSPMASDPAAQPEIPLQEPQIQAAETPPATPDLNIPGINTPEQNVSQPVDVTPNMGSSDVNTQEPQIDSAPGLSEDARQKLELAGKNLKEAVRQNLEALDKILGTNLADYQPKVTPVGP